MRIKLHLATLVSWDFSLATCARTPGQGPARYFDSGARENRGVLRESELRGRNEDVVGRNSSTSATASLDPYARLRGRKYPQFTVIRAEAAYPIGADLVELIGHH